MTTNSNITEFMQLVMGDSFQFDKLLPHQKILLKTVLESDMNFSHPLHFKSFRNDLMLDILKELEIDFNLAKPNGVEEYKKGKLVKTHPYKNKKKTNIILEEIEIGKEDDK